MSVRGIAIAAAGLETIDIVSARAGVKIVDPVTPIYLYTDSARTALATVYSDATMATPLSQPLAPTAAGAIPGFVAPFGSYYGTAGGLHFQFEAGSAQFYDGSGPGPINVFAAGITGVEADAAPKIQTLMDRAGAGAQFVWPAGTYTVAASLIPYNNTTHTMLPGGELRFTATATFQEAFRHRNHAGSVMRSLSGVRFKGFTVRELGGAYPAFGIQLGYNNDPTQWASDCTMEDIEAIGCGLDLEGGDVLRAIRCRVHDSALATRGIGLIARQDPTTNVPLHGQQLAEDCWVYNMTGAPGIITSGDGMVVRNCRISNVGATSFAIDTGGSINALVDGNIIDHVNGILSENAVGGVLHVVQNQVTSPDNTTGVAIQVWRPDYAQYSPLHVVHITDNDLEGANVGMLLTDLDWVYVTGNKGRNFGHHFINAIKHSGAPNWSHVEFIRNTGHQWGLVNTPDNAFGAGIGCNSANCYLDGNILVSTARNSNSGLDISAPASWGRNVVQGTVNPYVGAAAQTVLDALGVAASEIPNQGLAPAQVQSWIDVANNRLSFRVLYPDGSTFKRGLVALS